jgi:quercetin dioxygenase-like cupin family protein
MMFLINSGKHTFTSRTRFDLQKDGVLVNDMYDGCFVLSLDSTLSGRNIKLTGCFGAYSDEEFTLEGNFLAIKLAGVAFNRTVLSMIPSIGHGDLSYIDGCSNSGIIPPPRNGDPCVNYLFFPKGTVQTWHTHPSARIGFVIAGSGTAHLPTGNVPLVAGSCFYLDRHTNHYFSTTDSEMALLTFHPDSDSGPTDEFNPMKSRTYVK